MPASITYRYFQGRREFYMMGLDRRRRIIKQRLGHFVQGLLDQRGDYRIREVLHRTGVWREVCCWKQRTATATWNGLASRKRSLSQREGSSILRRMEDAADERYGPYGNVLMGCRDSIAGAPLQRAKSPKRHKRSGPAMERAYPGLSISASPGTVDAVTPVLLRRFSFLHISVHSAVWLRRKLRRAFTGFGSFPLALTLQAPPLSTEPV